MGDLWGYLWGYLCDRCLVGFCLKMWPNWWLGGGRLELRSELGVEVGAEVGGRAAIVKLTFWVLESICKQV